MDEPAVRNFLESDDLLIGISELSKMTQVSPRQLRYWEEKSYIQSASKESKKNRIYQLPTVFRVELIKHFLDKGYTLATAVEKAKNYQEKAHQARLLFRKTFDKIQLIDDRFVVVTLANFSNEQQILLLNDVETDQTLFQILPKDAKIVKEEIYRSFHL